MLVLPNQKELQYSGRIDFEDPLAPVLIYACSSVKIRFTGTSVKTVIENHHAYWTNRLGYILDGEQGCFVLPDAEGKQVYTLAENLAEGEHELLLFKRMDSCHTITFFGFELDEGAKVLALPQKPSRRMEFFGDSVSCGEVSEAVTYAGKEDPEHDGEYSNSWYSYAWMTARRLGAEIHDTSQGGIALLNGTGWFGAPGYLGMENCYDKLEYNPDLGVTKQWDFSKYTPQVVVVAIGQNDSHPEDYMAENYDGEKAVYWRKHYRMFIERLMELYPGAQIILATTILEHDASWDRAIEEVCKEIGSVRVHHFLYSKNGCGTPGHIRIPEARQMAEELTGFIETLGDGIWAEEKGE